MKKLTLIFLIVFLINAGFCQSILNNNAHIISKNDSYWVIGSGNFSLINPSHTNPAIFENLSVESAASLTVNSTSSLTINGTLTNKGTFTINSDVHGSGSLITNGAINNTGTMSIHFFVGNDAWHLISIPNSVTTANTFLGNYLQT